MISDKEFQGAFKKLGLDLEEGLVLEVFRLFDLRNNGFIAYTDFLAVIFGSE